MPQIQKYIWVINTILNNGKITLKKLNEKWKANVDLSGGLDLPRQTFDRWKGSILDLFGIIIECERRGGYKYYIENPEILVNGELRKWLLDTYGTADTLSNNLSLHDRILTEEVPSSQKFLSTILNTMQSNNIIKIAHQSFGNQEPIVSTVEPYCVKMSGQRWYLLARNIEKDKLLLYSLDRIQDIEITKETFHLPSDFNAKDFFSEYYGIYIDDKVPLQRIILRADKWHKYYMRTLPLHPSQKEINTTDDYADFEVTLRPTYDFYMKLLSFGNMIKVLEPSNVRLELEHWIKNTMNIYEL